MNLTNVKHITGLISYRDRIIKNSYIDKLCLNYIQIPGYQSSLCFIRETDARNDKEIVIAECHIWLSARKKFKGAKDNRSLFFKAIGYCFYCPFYCFSKILGGKRLLGGAKAVLGGAPCPPVAESQHIANQSTHFNQSSADVNESFISFY